MIYTYREYGVFGPDKDGDVCVEDEGYNVWLSKDDLVAMLDLYGLEVAEPVEEEAVRFGCHFCLTVDEPPAECVIGTPNSWMCTNTKLYTRKEQCPHWKPVDGAKGGGA